MARVLLTDDQSLVYRLSSLDYADATGVPLIIFSRPWIPLL